MFSQRDVPGTTRSALPILAAAGVRAVSVGVNGASTPPDVPRAFVWVDPVSGISLPALWHPYGYGGNAFEDAVIIPGLSTALVMDWRGDNAGPPANVQVRTAAVAAAIVYLSLVLGRRCVPYTTLRALCAEHTTPRAVRHITRGVNTQRHVCRTHNAAHARTAHTRSLTCSAVTSQLARDHSHTTQCATALTPHFVIQEVVNDWANIGKVFPGAKVVAATFSDFLPLLEASAAAGVLPMVEAELGDTWVHGSASGAYAYCSCCLLRAAPVRAPRERSLLAYLLSYARIRCEC